MKLPKLVAFSILAILVAGVSARAWGQETDQVQIYLEEPEKEPSPKIVRQDVKTENYDAENRRLERGVALLSNDQVVNHGKYVEFYRDGKKYSEGVYEMGLLTGQWQYWHPNGKTCKTVNFKLGRPHGQWDVFRPDGSRSATKSYENGLKHGSWFIYFEDGEQPKVELTYNLGTVEGERKIFYSSGQVRQRVPFQEGLMHGTVTNYNEEGEKTSELLFEKGKPVGKPQVFDVTS